VPQHANKTHLLPRKRRPLVRYVPKTCDYQSEFVREAAPITFALFWQLVRHNGTLSVRVVISEHRSADPKIEERTLTDTLLSDNI